MIEPVNLHLFDAFGVELEYMIVDKDTLEVKPIADRLFFDTLGYSGNEAEFPMVSWSNELALHIIELKTTIPEKDFRALSDGFRQHIAIVNEKLSKYNAMLLPGAAHPWMDPMKETRLWQNENSEIYETYNRIFDCRGHGWSNLQSTHINLPFQGDEEFGRLHAAIRLILPIIPALSASSPILDGKPTGMLNTRLRYYEKNQAIIPCITAKVIPEPVFSERDYKEFIYEKIIKDVAPYDPNKILEPVWLNSRGAIARFDRGAIEIRIIDIQECPAADLAILSLAIGALQALVREQILSFEKQKGWDTERLYRIYSGVIVNAEKTMIDDLAYLEVFGLKKPSYAGDLWKHISQIVANNPESPITPWQSQLNVILGQGTLATRILRSLDNHFSRESLQNVYRSLAVSLRDNKLFQS